jgi:steroid delta-isomerase-like uncharacterized protein
MSYGSERMNLAAHDIAQLAADLLSAWNTHEVDRIVDFYAHDFVGEDVAQSTTQHGRDGVKGTVQRYLNAFPDLQFDESETIVQGNRTVQRWTAHGTHRGTLMHIPATGRPVTISGVTFLTIENGKVTRATLLWDVAGLLRSIGLLPNLS